VNSTTFHSTSSLCCQLSPPSIQSGGKDASGLSRSTLDRPAALQKEKTLQSFSPFIFVPQKNNGHILLLFPSISFPPYPFHL